MVNTIKEPHITPDRPRVSSGASTSLSRSTAVNGHSMSGKSRIPRLVASSSIKKRAPLGEMSDNVEIASSQQVTRPRGIAPKAAKQPIIKTRISISSTPSRDAQRSLEVSTSSITSSPPVLSVGDETQLLDITVADLPELSETDASDSEDPNAGLRQLLSRGSRITPPNSQEPLASLKPVSVPSLSARGHVSHLPTPPPSQTSFLVTPPRSSASQRRPRPSATPPRPVTQPSSSQTTLLSPAEIIDPSPNPRRKKTPRHSPGEEETERQAVQRTARSGDHPSLRTPSSSQPRESHPSSQGSASTARKPRASRARKSAASPRASSPRHTPRTSRKSSVGLPGELPKSAQSLTPAGKKLVRAGGSTLLKKALRATPGEDPLLLGGWDGESTRRRSQAVNDDAPLGAEGQSEAGGQHPPPTRDKGKGRAIVFPSPPRSAEVISSPGPPPIPKHPNNDLSVSLARFVAELPDPLADESVAYDGGLEDAGFASESEAGDDGDAIGNDTFYHVRARQWETSTNAAPKNDVPADSGEPAAGIAEDLDRPSRKLVEEVDPENQIELKVSLDATRSSFAERVTDVEDIDTSANIRIGDDPFDARSATVDSSTPSLQDKLLKVNHDTTSTSVEAQPAEKRSSVLVPSARDRSSPFKSLPASLSLPPSPSASTTTREEYVEYIAPLAGGDEVEEETEVMEGEGDAATVDGEDVQSLVPDGDVTLEGISDDWDVSGASIPSPKRDTFTTANLEKVTFANAPEPNITTPPGEGSFGLVFGRDLAQSDEDAPVFPDQRNESPEEEKEPLQASTDGDQSTGVGSSSTLTEPLGDLAPAVAVAPDRIVLKLVPKGIVKIEPESTAGAVALATSSSPIPRTSHPPNERDDRALPVEADATPVSFGEAETSSPPTAARPSTPERSTTALVSTTPTASPPSQASALPGSGVPAPVAPPKSTVERIPIRTTSSRIPSKLSQRWSAESLNQSPSRDESQGSNTQASSPPQLPPKPPKQKSNDSIRISMTKPPCLEANALADCDVSFSSVVEISSLDPRAAARAAAILKMNHAYIEHGDAPKNRSTPRHARRRSVHQSQHFESVEASRMISQEELLYEAELEIVTTHRERGRSMSVLSNRTATTDLGIPGGWVNSPKRKREHPASIRLDLESEIARSTTKEGRPWTVKDWKCLEKMYIQEKKEWVQEREVKQMPGGFTSWATRSLRAPEAVKEWDAERVVKRFMVEQGTKEGTGEWARDTIALRVSALERRVASKMTMKLSDDLVRAEPSPKRRRQHVEDTPARPHTSADTPSTLRKLLGFVWSPWTTSAASESAAEAAPSAPSQRLNSSPLPGAYLDGSVRNKGTQHQIPLVMEEILPLRSTRPHADSALVHKPALVLADSAASSKGVAERQISSAFGGESGVGSSSGRIEKWTQSIPPAPSPMSASRIATENHRPSPRIYPPLPSITQRSAALKALFPTIHPLNDSTSSTTSATSTSSARSQPITIPKRSNSIQDLVKSFEEAKTLDRALELRRSQSSSSLRPTV